MADDTAAENETGTDLTKLKVPDLKKLLKSRGLSTTGNKCDLIERLQNATHDMSGDDLLEESAAGDSEGAYDELEELDESALMGDEKDDESKEKIPEDEECDEPDGPPEKKKRVVINRNASKEPPQDLKKKGVEEDVEDEEEGEGLEVDEMDEEEVLREEVVAPAAPVVAPVKAAVPEVKTASTAVVSSTGPAEVTQAQPPTNGEAPKRIVKIKDLSTKEKLELRAQKFGLTESAKKEIRAQRFGKAQGNETDILKKRAERFGIASPEVSKTDLVQKLEARKERFQGTSTVTAPQVTAPSKHKLITGPDSSTPLIKGDQFKKLAARKERFQGGAAPTPKPVPGPDSSSTTEKKVLPSQRVKITAT